MFLLRENSHVFHSQLCTNLTGGLSIVNNLHEYWVSSPITNKEQTGDYGTGESNAHSLFRRRVYNWILFR